MLPPLNMDKSMNVDESLSVAAARAAITADLTRIGECETLPLQATWGRVLAVAVTAPMDVPAHDNSAMDGWALRSADLHDQGVSLLQVGTALAGHPYQGLTASGQCVRIMTGAVIPRGCDTVVMQESVQAQGNTIRIPSGQRAGQNVRLAGEDIARGAVALPAGTLLRPAHLGLAASLGITSLTVCRRPRVAVFSTGDELRSPRGTGQSLDEGAIYDSNRAVLVGMLSKLGCDIRDLGVVRDDPALLEAALRQAADWADVVITSGGASSGDSDHIRRLLARLGEVRFCNIAMRPGRPMAFGALHTADQRACMMFALPGNPVAAAVSFAVFVRGALLHIQGASVTEPLMLQARARQAIGKKPGRTEYLRGIIEHGQGSHEAGGEGGVHVRLTGAQGSGMLSSLCAADCLLVLHHEQCDVPQGGWVDILLLDGLM